MVEVVGIAPILKILALSLLIVFGAFLTGQVIVYKSSSNPALQFFVGLSTLVGIMAIIVTKGFSVFTPSLLCLLILFKPSLKINTFQLIQSLRNTAFFMLFFVLVMLMELHRQSFFSKQMINSGFGDYQFYISAARNIFEGGVESSLAYLNHYGLDTYTNIYHYFDLYLLGPIFLLNIPSLVGYLFFFLPLMYASAAYSLYYLLEKHFNRLVLIIASLLALHIVGSEWSDMTAFRRLSIIHYPKSCLVFFPLLMLDLRKEWSLSKVLVGMSLLSLMLNPLIFVLITATSAVIFLVMKGNSRVAWSQLFQPSLLIIYLFFGIYFILVFSEKSDNSVLYTFMEDTSLKQFFTGVINRFIGYSGVIKKLPIVVFSVVLLGIHFYKTRKIPFELLFVFSMFFIGHIANAFMFNHYEGMQFFNISIVTLMAVLFFYSFAYIKEYKLLLQKIVFMVFLLVTVFSYTISSGYTVITEPRSEFFTSVSFNKRLHSALDGGAINALFFKNYTEETHWIRTIPYLTYGAGYLNLNRRSECILPTHAQMFRERSAVKQNAINLIGRAPFSQYCEEQGLQPTSFYDADFREAIRGFIENQSINVLIFEKEMPLPNWVEELSLKERISPQEDFDKHRILVL